MQCTRTIKYLTYYLSYLPLQTLKTFFFKYELFQAIFLMYSRDQYQTWYIDRWQCDEVPYVLTIILAVMLLELSSPDLIIIQIWMLVWAKLWKVWHCNETWNIDR